LLDTRLHTAPCLTKANTYPRPVTFARAPHVLAAGHSLREGQRLVSPDRHTQVRFSEHGNLNLRNARGVIWSTHTNAVNGRALLQPNGQLVVLDVHGHVRWHSPAISHSGTKTLRVLDNGQLAIFAGSVKVWHTNTHTP